MSEPLQLVLITTVGTVVVALITVVVGPIVSDWVSARRERFKARTAAREEQAKATIQADQRAREAQRLELERAYRELERAYDNGDSWRKESQHWQREAQDWRRRAESVDDGWYGQRPRRRDR